MTSTPPQISVVIPTRRRPDSLVRAARSVFRQLDVSLATLELIVVDNDPDASAKDVARRLKAEAPFPLVYVHKPEPGVAGARNAGLAAASGPMIAFLDDDEEASPGWLAALTAVQARFDADVVFGPVRGRAPDGVDRHRDYFEGFFSRIGPAEAQVLDGHYGCGDSLIRRAALPHPTAPFALSRNHIGGEDDLLFQQMRAAGRSFAWAPEAWVWEHPEPTRVTLGYALRRAFAYGQGPTFACVTSTPPDWTGAVRWMAVGLGQTLVFGAAALAKWVVRSPDRAQTFDRAARGLGKLLWFGPFKQRFYGLP